MTLKSETKNVSTLKIVILSKDGLFKYDCLDCDSQVINCSNYDTKRSCEENQCLTDEYCQWTFGVPSGTCRTVGYVGGEAQLFDLGLD